MDDEMEAEEDFFGGEELVLKEEQPKDADLAKLVAAQQKQIAALEEKLREREKQLHSLNTEVSKLPSTEVKSPRRQPVPPPMSKSPVIPKANVSGSEFWDSHLENNEGNDYSFEDIAAKGLWILNSATVEKKPTIAQTQPIRKPADQRRTLPAKSTKTVPQFPSSPPRQVYQSPPKQGFPPPAKELSPSPGKLPFASPPKAQPKAQAKSSIPIYGSESPPPQGRLPLGASVPQGAAPRQRPQQSNPSKARPPHASISPAKSTSLRQSTELRPAEEYPISQGFLRMRLKPGGKKDGAKAGGNPNFRQRISPVPAVKPEGVKAHRKVNSMALPKARN